MYVWMNWCGLKTQPLYLFQHVPMEHWSDEMRSNPTKRDETKCCECSEMNWNEMKWDDVMRFHVKQTIQMCVSWLIVVPVVSLLLLLLSFDFVVFQFTHTQTMVYLRSWYCVLSIICDWPHRLEDVFHLFNHTTVIYCFTSCPNKQSPYEIRLLASLASYNTNINTLCSPLNLNT